MALSEGQGGLSEELVRPSEELVVLSEELVVQNLAHPLCYMEAALRLYGNPKLLKVAEAADVLTRKFEKASGNTSLIYTDKLEALRKALEELNDLMKQVNSLRKEEEEEMEKGDMSEMMDTDEDEKMMSEEEKMVHMP